MCLVTNLFVEHFKQFISEFLFIFIVFIASLMRPRIFPSLKPFVFRVRDEDTVGDSRETIIPCRILMDKKTIILLYTCLGTNLYCTSNHITSCVINDHLLNSLVKIKIHVFIYKKRCFLMIFL